MNEKHNEGMKQVCYIANHVHTSVCMNVGTCVCMRRVSVGYIRIFYRLLPGSHRSQLPVKSHIYE